MSLKEYAKKRDFAKTAEPKGAVESGASRHRFVIQKHAASRLHYDFRLELDGTLKSWAVPKGVPFKKGERRLAVHVEDHPSSYIDFEGTIPQGQYGGGTVMVWDRGTFEPLSETPSKDLAGGKLHFVLSGKKLRGEWYLVQLRGGDEWLLIKGGEDMKPVSDKQDDTSVLSGKSMEALSKGAGKVWQSNRVDAKPSFKEKIATLAKSTGAKKKPARPAADKTTKKRARSATARTTRSANRSVPSSPSVRAKASSVVPEFIEPMKAGLVDSPPAGSWIYEIKFDGFRAIAFRDQNGTRLLSRNNKDFAVKFPEVLTAVAALDVDDAVIDGEIVALDEKGRSSFQLLQAYDLGEKRPPLFFYAFDLLQLNGRDLQGLPLVERKAELEKLLRRKTGVLRYSKSLGNEPERLLDQARELGLEGLIGKRPESHYEAGHRSGNWIKLKLNHEQEFVIGGYTPPGGTRLHFGALLVGVYDGGELKFAGKVGTGFNTKLLRSLHAQFSKIETEQCPFVDLPEKRTGRYGQGITAAEMRRCHWVKPVMVCQLKFTEWTRDNRLRHPVFLGLREDKAAKGVIRETKT
ncbi:MAG: non-homologous end-joining DNA ligase [Opitutus sp.]